MITLDVGILMGSQSNQVFREMVDVYPGANKVLEVTSSIPCHCGDPESCARKAFQLVVGQASNGDRNEAAKFIEEAAEACHTHEQLRDLMVKYYDKNTPKEPSIIYMDGFDKYSEHFN